MLGNEEVPGQSDWCIWWRKIREWLYEQVHGVMSIILTWVEQPVFYTTVSCSIIHLRVLILVAGQVWVSSRGNIILICMVMNLVVCLNLAMK